MLHRRVWADCVEKLRISDAVIFRKEPAIPKSQMRSATRRSELGYEWQKTNLAEPLASKSWLRRTGKNFADFAKNGVFQQYRLILVIRGTACVGPLRQSTCLIFLIATDQPFRDFALLMMACVPAGMLSGFN